MPSTTERPVLDHAVAGLPRLLRGISLHEPMALADHENVHGPAPRAPRRGRRAGIIDVVARAGLRGRGGGAFPTAAKMRAVASHRRRPAVVVNATEGEPASGKDQLLMTGVPHLVLDGAECTAMTLGAEEVTVCVCASARASVEATAHAIAERVPRRGHGPRFTLRTIPPSYLVGQETALIDFLNGGAGIPTFTPPRPSERGFAGRPTMLSNAETFAHMALIVRHGPAWFRQLGTADEPGSCLVTLSGAVAAPGVYEMESGLSMRSLVQSAGGTTGEPAAALIGGYGGAWVGREQLAGLELSGPGLARHGATLGAGVVLLLDRAGCGIAETRRLIGWLAAQSSGQCGPCVHGLRALASEFAEISGGIRTGGYDQRLERLVGMVEGRGACGHPDGACRLLLSAITVFRSELAEHAERGLCEGCLSASQLPRITALA